MRKHQQLGRIDQTRGKDQTQSGFKERNRQIHRKDQIALGCNQNLRGKYPEAVPYLAKGEEEFPIFYYFPAHQNYESDKIKLFDDAA